MIPFDIGRHGIWGIRGILGGGRAVKMDEKLLAACHAVKGRTLSHRNLSQVRHMVMSHSGQRCHGSGSSIRQATLHVGETKGESGLKKLGKRTRATPSARRQPMTILMW